MYVYFFLAKISTCSFLSHVPVRLFTYLSNYSHVATFITSCMFINFIIEFLAVYYLLYVD